MNEQAQADSDTMELPKAAAPSYWDSCDDKCYLCARPLRTKARGTRWIRVVGGGGLLARMGAPSSAFDAAGDLGYLPICPRCARKIPAAFKGAWA